MKTVFKLTQVDSTGKGDFVQVEIVVITPNAQKPGMKRQVPGEIAFSEDEQKKVDDFLTILTDKVNKLTPITATGDQTVENNVKTS